METKSTSHSAIIIPHMSREEGSAELNDYLKLIPKLAPTKGFVSIIAKYGLDADVSAAGNFPFVYKFRFDRRIFQDLSNCFNS